MKNVVKIGGVTEYCCLPGLHGKAQDPDANRGVTVYCLLAQTYIGFCAITHSLVSCTAEESQKPSVSSCSDSSQRGH